VGRGFIPPLLYVCFVYIDAADVVGVVVVVAVVVVVVGFVVVVVAVGPLM